MTALVCDIGGTNTRLGLTEGGAILAGSLASFANDDFASFDALLSAYVGQRPPGRLAGACIALAAPATPEGAKLTNRDWTITRAGTAAASGAESVFFINDFEALGFSLAHVERLETRPLCEGDAAPASATRLVLGAGTGFNAAALLRDPVSGRPVVAAAECGHMTLPLEGADEHDLQAFLSKGRGRASVERALSGRGLTELYQWCCERTGGPPRFETSPEIVANALADAPDPQCRAAAELFSRLLGRVAGDLALAYLPMGGVYLAGGVSRALMPLIATQDIFLDAFRAKGRMSDFMKSFPISFLTDDRVALTGCAEWLAARGVD